MVEFKSDFDVEYVDGFGDDELICKAARVSTLGAASIETDESAGLIRFLMRNRHGTPFEHGSMCFRISAPIFVWREFMRHRIGISYNEQSGRYMEMEPVFYAPSNDRPLVQIGKPGEYEFVAGTYKQFGVVLDSIVHESSRAWESYQIMIDWGIAKEVARMVLPVNIYSTAYVTMNPRSLMNFLSLRTKDDTSVYPSYPMCEIEAVAQKIELAFSNRFPLTHEAFQMHGRVSP